MLWRKIKKLIEIRNKVNTIKNSDLFDANWYRNMYHLRYCEDLAGHYLLIGYKLGYNPSEKFSTEDYLLCNADVRDDDINPLYHYEKYGKTEKRCIIFENDTADNENKSEGNKKSDEKTPPYNISDEIWQDIKIIEESSLFDADWYRDTYHLEQCKHLAGHYLYTGYMLGYNPSENFSTKGYFLCNEDVYENNTNPLYHYEKYGKKEGRSIKTENDYIMSEIRLIKYSKLFDAEWYRRQYDIPDMIAAAEHYYTTGYKLGYNPSPFFSTEGYLKYNRDVRDKGINPLVHYEMEGQKEFRIINYVE